MQRRSQAIIGLTILALGVGVFSLGLLSEESTVRYVHDLHDDPAAHGTGTYTVLGIPQPRTLANQGDAANPEFHEATVSAVRWQEGGATYVATHTLSAHDDDGTRHWSLLNETRGTGSTAVVAHAWTNWTQPAAGILFQVQDFESGQRVWAVFEGVLREPILPKPSQLTGRLLEAPQGALVYGVDPDGFTVGCSSKFLPDDVAAQYDPDGDGYADSAA